MLYVNYHIIELIKKKLLINIYHKINIENKFFFLKDIHFSWISFSNYIFFTFILTVNWTLISIHFHNHYRKYPWTWGSHMSIRRFWYSTQSYDKQTCHKELCLVWGNALKLNLRLPVFLIKTNYNYNMYTV